MVINRYNTAVSVICPFYNEQSIIVASTQQMIVNLRKQFGENWELILINDGSTDASLRLLVAAAKQQFSQEPISIISSPINQGRGRALKLGIDRAKNDVIVTTEVDCSWGDDIVLRLTKELTEHPEVDFIVASPHLPGGGLANVPFKRVFLTKLGNLLIRSFFNSGMTMNTGMTRAYRRQVIQPLVVHENGKEFHLEVLLKLLTLGFKGREIPATITWPSHRAGNKEKTQRKSSTKILKTIRTHLNFIAIAQPVRYFTALSFLSLIVGFIFEGAAVYALLTKAFPAIYLATLGLLMLLFCLLFAGFTVLFFQFREFMREKWMSYYKAPYPPSARQGYLAYSVDHLHPENIKSTEEHFNSSLTSISS